MMSAIVRLFKKISYILLAPIFFVSNFAFADQDVAKLHSSTPHSVNVASSNQNKLSPTSDSHTLSGPQSCAMDAVSTHPKDSQAVVDTHVHQVSTSSGIISTLDLYGDNLVHFKYDSKSNADTTKNSSNKNSSNTVSMPVTDARKVVNGCIATTGSIEANKISVGSDGSVKLTPNKDVTETSSVKVIKSPGEITTVKTTTIVQTITTPVVTAPTTPSISNGDVGGTTNSNNTPVINNPSVSTTITPVITTQPVTITSSPVVTTPTITTTPVITPIVTPAPDEGGATNMNSAPVINNPSETSASGEKTTQSSVVITPTQTTTPSISNGDVGSSSSVNNIPVINNFAATSTVSSVNPIVGLNENNSNTTFLSTTPIISGASMIGDTSKLSLPAVSDDNKGLIVVGQVVRVAGNVTEVDENGQQHQLFVGDNVHLGSKYVAKNSQGAVVDVQYFNGEVEHVLK